MDRKGRNGGTLRSYKKGQSGNPAGRPPKKPDLISQIIREMGNDWDDLEVTLISRREGGRPTYYHQSYSGDGQSPINMLIAQRLLFMAMDGNLEAIAIILDRTEGQIPPPLTNKRDASQGAKLKVWTAEEVDQYETWRASRTTETDLTEEAIG